MTPYRLRRISFAAACAMVGMLSSATTARAQVDVGTPSQQEALTTAAKASRELVDGLAKEMGSTPEQAAGAAGVVFAIAQSVLKPEDFAGLSKAVPGMDALLAAAPSGVVGTPAQPASRFTPGFASAPSSTSGMAPTDGMTSAMAGFSNLGIKPEMIAKAIPFLTEYLKKYGAANLGSLLGSLFKMGK